jgi:hypothetical protein
MPYWHGALDIASTLLTMGAARSALWTAELLVQSGVGGGNDGTGASARGDGGTMRRIEKPVNAMFLEA